MTNNQINYWNLQETKRHNVVSEDELKRHNIAGESETNRHNVQQEYIGFGNLAETTRHNKATEGYSFASLAEATRHNKAAEALQSQSIDLGYDQLAETTRSNQERERQTRVRDELNYWVEATKNDIAKVRNTLLREQFEEQIRQFEMQYLQNEKFGAWGRIDDTINSITNLYRSVKMAVPQQ